MRNYGFLLLVTLLPGSAVPAGEPPDPPPPIQAARRSFLTPGVRFLEQVRTRLRLRPRDEPANLRHLPRQGPTGPRVLVLALRSGDVSSELSGAERQLADFFCRELQDLAARRGERISFVPSRTVERFKKENPNWQEKELSRVTGTLGADLVIRMDVTSLDLYEPGSVRQLYRGRAAVTLSLVEANSSREPVKETCSFQFPSDAEGPVAVSIDIEAAKFQQLFLRHVARKLARYFSDHPTEERSR